MTNTTLPQSLGAFLEYLMDKRGVSGNALAKGMGIAESSVRNLLKYGIEPGTPAPKPDTLRKLGVYFGINPIYFFQLADYLPLGGANLTPHGAMIGRRFDQLPIDRQNAVISLMESFEQLEREKTYGEVYWKLLPDAQDLVKRRERLVFTADWYFDHTISSFLNTTPDAQFTPDSQILNIPYKYRAGEEETRYPYIHMIREHLHQVFGKQQDFTVDEIQTLLDHSMVRAMINLLLPNREINVASKLFYLVASLDLINEDMGLRIGFDVTSPATKETVEEANRLSQDIWQFLMRVSAL